MLFGQYDRFKTKLMVELREKRSHLLNHSFNSSNLKKSINLALKYAVNLPSL